ncbi:Zn(II)2Cys6 transcription factor [Aspergillus foveolatus]|uniref:Zn(II)2Cys6 transcription factor n=1 Tax=Aspergillus foveolatus TaxID=210207 RepID=UPI003CCDEFA2
MADMATLISKRAIRCDKTSPCSNCRLSGASCITLKPAARPKQARVLISSQYERKIDSIESRLDRLSNLVESLALQLHSAPPSQSAIQHSSTQRFATGNASSNNSTPDVCSRQVHDFPTLDDPAEKGRLLKGQSSSSLSAQSSFAVRFLHDAVDSKQERDITGEVTCLLKTISQLVESFSHQSLAATSLFPHARVEPTAGQPKYDMPPIEVTVSILREAQETDCVDIQLLAESFKMFLSPQSLSDLCLKVYFLPEYSDAEFIIVNAALYFFATWVGVIQQQANSSLNDVPENLLSTCRVNLETALSRLALYIQPSHEMVFALVLASSTILDSDITVPKPSSRTGSSPGSQLMEYFGYLVELARLAGRIYEELYCAGSLSLPVDVRRHRATESWLRSATQEQAQRIKSSTISEDVLRQSMLTLIYRAMPAQTGSSSTFNEECLDTARAALEGHQSFIREFGTTDTELLSGHIMWSILFVPFVPFIVLFCHVIETGSLQDLSQMQAFVTSMESVCPHSPAIAKHHHLFHVFCTVAKRYCDIMSTASSSEEQRRLRMEVDAQLSAFGLQSQLPAGISGPIPDKRISSLEADTNWPGGNLGDGTIYAADGFNLGDWFSFSQNIVGLLDRDDLSFQ